MVTAASRRSAAVAQQPTESYRISEHQRLLTWDVPGPGVSSKNDAGCPAACILDAGSKPLHAMVPSPMLMSIISIGLRKVCCLLLSTSELGPLILWTCCQIVMRPGAALHMNQ